MAETVLVTGGTGFVGTHIILQLLEKGFDVKTTLRSIDSKNKVIDTLRANRINVFDKLAFVEADLSVDDHWKTAMDGCDYVLSVASPVFFDIPKDENAVMRPAVEGIQRILRAARDTGVKRVVMTSNFGAVGFSKKNPALVTTEQDWTDVHEKGLSAYEKSKLLAERAAWDFIKNEGGGLTFATINPVAIMGPSLSEHFSGSFGLLTNLWNNKTKAIPNLPLNIVDVRDVADLHIRAMTDPNASGQRFIASADGQISMLEIAKLIKLKRPDVAGNIPSKAVPNWIIHFASLFNAHAKEGSLLLKMSRNVSNEKAKNILGWKPIANNEEIILASVDSMIKFGIVK
jgi:nucleoside-diphosphate-sugar epimerase